MWKKKTTSEGQGFEDCRACKGTVRQLYYFWSINRICVSQSFLRTSTHFFSTNTITTNRELPRKRVKIIWLQDGSVHVSVTPTPLKSDHLHRRQDRSEGPNFFATNPAWMLATLAVISLVQAISKNKNMIVRLWWSSCWWHRHDDGDHYW